MLGCWAVIRVVSANCFNSAVDRLDCSMLLGPFLVADSQHFSPRSGSITSGRRTVRKECRKVSFSQSASPRILSNIAEERETQGDERDPHISVDAGNLSNRVLGSEVRRFFHRVLYRLRPIRLNPIQALKPSKLIKGTRSNLCQIISTQTS